MLTAGSVQRLQISMFQTQEQEQVDLSSSIHTENIFNSESSGPAYPNIPQISSVHSFIGAKSSLLADAAPNQCLSFVDSAKVTSFDQSFHGSPSYKLNSAKLAVSSSEYLSVESSTEVDSTISLEAQVDRKRQKIQPERHSKTDNLNLFSDFDLLAPAFLTYYLPLFRGCSSGGNNKPPKKRSITGTQYVAASLRLESSTIEDICLPKWNENELKDNRRIIRIERRQQGNEIAASFSIVGSALENPHTKPTLDPDVEVLEVSCLRCLVNYDEIDDKQTVHGSLLHEVQSEFTEIRKQESTGKRSSYACTSNGTSIECQYYVTSVEVIKIIELLVGSHLIQDRKQRRKERGCIRSNLMPFWSKHLISSTTNTMKRRSVTASNENYIAELAHRIKTYEVRRPRKVNKDLRILEWSKLGPALRRALHSYYVAVPIDKFKNIAKPTNSELMFNIQ
ncbi:Hypothetical protein PP7435_CHR2-1294 [Komagataella phaffii CBS 7435]|uniref:DUF7082 domain-containing protein n=1 Tax=Komagataella phaffii (strain ATCC 76273 / CBS 7435 / CECT 11047 / NRRL Y-11430 / Wegner 21-1) TaxID=981350 RepID=F2QU89_KOMPC|nr:GQ67_00038T0 [Komagataella phaffii]AOA67695.1 GQ68_01349T0 [Komagataella phaffii GS115]CAH2448892.1 Hypothetical protein BQ9382_C2-6965 [Komagataella phaffii CBS 7435]CCA38967.1 Hypothetical protein PP7435_CHR2-1294 [Komagataella phaffii CBS 7435]